MELSFRQKFEQALSSPNQDWISLYKRDLSDKIPNNPRQAYLQALEELTKAEEQDKTDTIAKTIGIRVGIFRVAAKNGYEKIIYQIQPKEVNLNNISTAVRNNQDDILLYLLDKLNVKPADRKTVIDYTTSILQKNNRQDLIKIINK